MAVFLRNCWYMVGWSADIPPRTLVPFTLLNEPIVLYRKTDGELAALADRCCHRLAPLSIGRLEADDVRCMYHGLKFAPDGRCVEVPGQDRISAAICVRSFPVAERHNAAWVWMGDVEKVDLDLIPPITGPNDPDWALIPSHIDINAAATLICDNLLDISHAPYVHGNSFGGGDETFIAITKKAEIQPHVEKLARGVRVTRWHVGRPSNPYTGAEPSDDLVINDFLAPGVFILTTRVYRPGAHDRSGGAIPTEEMIASRCTCQMITPVTDKTSRFFFNFGPWAKFADNKQHYFDIGARAFAEDKKIIEAQQDMIDRSPSTKMMSLVMDEVATRYQSVLRKLTLEETSQPG